MQVKSTTDPLTSDLNRLEDELTLDFINRLHGPPAPLDKAHFDRRGQLVRAGRLFARHYTAAHDDLMLPVLFCVMTNGTPAQLSLFAFAAQLTVSAAPRTRNVVNAVSEFVMSKDVIDLRPMNDVIADCYSATVHRAIALYRSEVTAYNTYFRLLCEKYVEVHAAHVDTFEQA